MNQNTQLEQNRSRSVRRSNAANGQGTADAEQELALKPAYDIQETEDAWGLTVHLPGVGKDSLELSAEQGRFVVRARRSWRKPETWSTVYRETVEARYELVLEHENLIAPDKIHAELKHGVLRVSLPKAEAIKPRKISVS